MFDGVTTALLTPFKNDKVDFFSLEKLLATQLQMGVKNLVVLGTTAESTLLTKKEKKQVLNFVVKKTKKQAKIIAGAGTPSTFETLANACEAEKAGVDGLLVVSPYYTKATDEGLLSHFKRLKTATKLPVVAYNVKHRTGFDFPVFVLQNLAENGDIVALKETTTDIRRVRSIAKNCKDLNLLCGNDSLLFEYQTIQNTVGIVSVLSNCLPKISIDAFNKIDSAMTVFRDFAGILSIEISPVAAKYLAYKLRIFDTPEMRLPLSTLSADKQNQIDLLVEKYKGGLM